MPYNTSQWLHWAKSFICNVPSVCLMLLQNQILMYFRFKILILNFISSQIFILVLASGMHFSYVNLGWNSFSYKLNRIIFGLSWINSLNKKFDMILKTIMMKLNWYFGKKHAKKNNKKNSPIKKLINNKVILVPMIKWKIIMNGWNKLIVFYKLEFIHYSTFK